MPPESIDLRDHVRDVPDFPKPGIVFKDITPLLGHPGAFQAVIDRLAQAFQDQKLDAVAAAEALLAAAGRAGTVLAAASPRRPLRVAPAQLPFVADSQPVVAIALAKAYIRPDGRAWHPYGLYTGDRIVGFVAIAHDAADGSCWFYHYFIDAAHQGRGHGTAGLGAAIALVAAPPFAARAILLTVNPVNAAGQRLYARVGFRPTGEELHGEQVWRLALG